MNPQMPSQPTPRENGGSSFLAASIVLIAVIIIGALYFWHERRAPEAMPAGEEEMSGATLEINADLRATSTDEKPYNLDESNFNAS